jgi:hypothetical protein
MMAVVMSNGSGDVNGRGSDQVAIRWSWFRARQEKLETPR